MNIQKSNELIAKYMNLTRISDTEWISPVIASSTKNLIYNVSWGWLMPVVEKISKLPTGDTTSPQDTFYPRTFGMITEDGMGVMVRFNCCILFTAPSLIEATFLAVVDFI